MISYIGGKSIIGKWIREYIPRDIETYVETFGGMFWVYFCMNLRKYPRLKTVVYNDFNQLNSNLFECVKDYDNLYEILLEQDCQPKNHHALEPNHLVHCQTLIFGYGRAGLRSRQKSRNAVRRYHKEGWKCVD